MSEQKPSIGRIVHFVLPEGHQNGGQHRPAIVMATDGDSVILHVFHLRNEPESFYNRVAQQDQERKAPGTWHWPERE
jgi:hypothetical protein